eukprot:Colp12_sorted_trinity150504_noHs@28768
MMAQHSPKISTSPALTDQFHCRYPKLLNAGHKFVSALVHMLEDPLAQNAVRWSIDGRSILIHNSESFEKEVLPRYFRTGKLSSFARQMNLYGFKRFMPSFSSSSPENRITGFSHPDFTIWSTAEAPFFITRKRRKSSAASKLDDSQESMKSQDKIEGGSLNDIDMCDFNDSDSPLMQSVSFTGEIDTDVTSSQEDNFGSDMTRFRSIPDWAGAGIDRTMRKSHSDDRVMYGHSARGSALYDDMDQLVPIRPDLLFNQQSHTCLFINVNRRVESSIKYL